MSTHKRDWMMVSLQLLLEHGVDGITIASLTAKLGVTKGSFYHHFRDMADFRTQMLEMCLEESTTRVIDRVKAGTTPRERLHLLEEMAAANDPLEVAIRAWALRDAQAHATLEEIDRRRMDFIEALFGDCGLSSADRRAAARLFYAVFIGGLHVMPPFSTEHMHSAFATIRQHYGIEAAAHGEPRTS